jgi:hypothetical protein
MRGSLREPFSARLMMMTTMMNRCCLEQRRSHYIVARPPYCFTFCVIFETVTVYSHLEVLFAKENIFFNNNVQKKKQFQYHSNKQKHTLDSFWLLK